VRIALATDAWTPPASDTAADARQAGRRPQFGYDRAQGRARADERAGDAN